MYRIGVLEPSSSTLLAELDEGGRELSRLFTFFNGKYPFDFGGKVWPLLS